MDEVVVLLKPGLEISDQQKTLVDKCDIWYMAKQTVPSLVTMNHSCQVSYFFHTPSLIPCAVITSYCLTIEDDISHVRFAPCLPVSPPAPQTQALTPLSPGGLTPYTVK